MIYICGCNNSSQLGEKSNNKSPSGFLSVSPPIKSHLDPTTISSYSIYSDHSVIITHDGSVYGIGDNSDYRISTFLPKQVIDQYTKFTIKDSKDHSYLPISAVCGETYTLYLVSTPDSPSSYNLAYSYVFPKNEFPLFLNINGHKPVSIFGGRWDSAAIDSEGAIIFIPESIPDSPNQKLERIFLNGNEKAVSIVFCNTFVVALAQSGKVFISQLPESCKLSFVQVDELKEIKISSISGTYNHCLAVSEDGGVFGRGSNKYGKLGIGQEIEEVDKFVEIPSFRCRYKIKSAFAGSTHSLFVTSEGKVLACGTNDFGQLILNHKPSQYCLISPIDTDITEGATYCVAGDSISTVFVNCEQPKNSPNQTIKNFS